MLLSNFIVLYAGFVVDFCMIFVVNTPFERTKNEAAVSTICRNYFISDDPCKVIAHKREYLTYSLTHCKVWYLYNYA